MASYISFEGTQDYLIHMPALIMTFKASGSITAGQAVGIGTDGEVFALGTTDATAAAAARMQEFIGIATKTTSDDGLVPVITWGPVKNIVAQTAITAGQFIIPSGSGRFAPATYSAGGTNGYTPFSSPLTYSGSLTAGRALTTGAASGTFNALIHGF